MVLKAVNYMAVRELMLSLEEHRKNRDIYSKIHERIIKILDDYLEH